MSVELMKRRLRRRIEERGTQLAFSLAAGVSQAHVSEVLNDKARPSEKLLEAIGLEEVVSYKARGQVLRGGEQAAAS